MSADLIIYSSLPLLLIASGVFSGSETAMFGLTHADRVRLRRDYPAAARVASRLLAQPRRLLVTVLLLNMTVNVTYFVLTSVLALRASGALEVIAISIGTLAAIILLGEILPKLLANSDRVRGVRLVAPILATAQATVAPLLTALERGLVSPLARVLAPPSVQSAAPNPQEITALLSEAARTGAIDTREQRLLAEVVELGRRRVRDVMTPRVDIAWLDAAEVAPGRVAEVLRSLHHHTVPVASDDLSGESLEGMLDCRRYLAAGGGEGFRAFLSPCRFIPENARLDRLLERFREIGDHTALCVDELGEITGLVQIEDVVRSLVESVGVEIGADREAVHLVALGAWSVPGRLPLHELAADFGVDEQLLDRRVSTIAGLVQLKLGRLPEVSDVIEVGRLTLEVEQVEARDVQRVIVRLPSAEEGSA